MTRSGQPGWPDSAQWRYFANHAGLTGQRLDATGLPYYHARYYNPWIARFISADSIIPGQSDKAGTANPQSLNRYSYVNNSPLSHTDPTGHVGSCLSGGDGQCGGEGWGKGPGDSTAPGYSGPQELSPAEKPIAEPADPAPVSEIPPQIDPAVEEQTLVARDSGISDNTVQTGATKTLPDDALVCRGGTCKAEQFATGTGVTLDDEGKLLNVSVNIGLTQ